MLFCMIVPNSFGQKPIEKLKAKKVAFITQLLNLSVEEAQQFWPVYNEFEGKLEGIKERKRVLMKKLQREYKALTDEELSLISDQFIDSDIEEANLKREYHDKYKKVLPIRKVIKYYKAQNQFKKQVIREIQGRKQNRGKRHFDEN